MDRYGLFLTPEEVRTVRKWLTVYEGEFFPHIDKEDEDVADKIRKFINIDEYLKNNKVK